jgi:alpha-1,3-rhamnosyl/mannosyltransferase
MVFEHNFHRYLPQSVHFLAISESARQEIIRVLGIPPERVSRTYMGVRPHLRPLPPEAIEPVRRRLGLPDEYLLHVGTIEPRKNLLMLMRAYGDLPEVLRRRCPLVLAGGWGWNTQDIADHYESVARHLGVVRIGYLPDEDLGAVYGGARALVFPSHYEGFGLPPVEMMACGGAVVASRIGPVEETVGGQAHLIEPEDLAGWRDAMARAIADDDWRDGLRQGAVEKACPYTWEQCAADTLGAYRLALRQAGAAGSRAA